MIRFTAGHPTAANLFMVLFLVAGGVTLPHLLRETIPDYASSEVEVRIRYPGATAEEVEEAVTQRVEDAVDGVNFVEELRSDSREGLSITVVQMTEGGDFQTFFNDIERGVDSIDDFPGAVELPIVKELGRTDLVLGIQVTGIEDAPALKAYSEDLKDRMQEAGVSLVEVHGFSDRQLRVTLSTSALESTGLTVPQVARAIAAQSRDTPLGIMETPEQDILLRFDARRRTPLELERLVVWAGSDGAMIRLGDIATIEDQFEFAEDKIESGGRRTALLHVLKTKSEDTIRVAERAKAFLEQERLRRPQITLTVTQDTSLILADRLNMLVSNGVQGMALVFLVMWAFFHLRISFWVAMGLPVSFFGAFFLAPHIGLSLNMYTMVGLLLALGLLMDDAIVIAENIAVHRQGGKSPLTAAVDGTREVAAGVFSSFLTTLCILGPLAFISGQIGRVLRVVPMMLLLVLSISLVEAFIILPAHLTHAMRHIDPTATSQGRRRFSSFIDWLRDNLAGKMVETFLRHRYGVLGALVALFIFTIGMLGSGRIKVQGFPDLEGDVIVARLLMPQGTPLPRTEATVRQILDALEETDQVFTPQQSGNRHLVQNAYVQYGQNSEAFEHGPHVATLTVDLISAEGRVGTIAAYLAEWRNRIGVLPDTLSLTLSEPSFGPGGRPIEVRLRGRDLDRLKSAAEDMHAWFSRYEGVVNLSDDLRPGKVEIRVRIRDDAYGIGLTSGDVAQQLGGAFQGVIADELQRGPEAYEVDVRLAGVDRKTLGELDDFMLRLSDGRQVPLRSVATWELGGGWARIARFDRMRAVTLYGDVDTRVLNTVELMDEFKRDYLPDFHKTYPDVQPSIAGELAETRQARKAMLGALVFGSLGIFVLLSFQFRTYTEPLIVMIGIPFSIIGVIWGHVLMREPISMPSLLGFIALAGVVVNNSILLVIFLKDARQRSTSLLEAAAGASRSRFRAILLTSSTTIAGLLPILFESSLQAQILKPLVISTAFGLLSSTVLILLVLPCFYMILGDLGWIKADSPEGNEHEEQ